jgi:hypothetical protein
MTDKIEFRIGKSVDTRSIELLRAFQKNPPATIEEIESTESAMHLKLSDGHRKFLLSANGGEGFIGPHCYAMLWGVKDLQRFNQEYEVRHYAPGLLLLGSNGGGEGFAFDMRSSSKPVVSVPFIGMALDEIVLVATTFDGFLEYLGDQ